MSMCCAITCLVLSLGVRASAEAIQCSPTDSTSTCHVSDQSVLLQSRLKVSGDPCNPGPCEVRGEQPGGMLELDIFTPAAKQANAGKASPVVLVFHGNKGTLKSVHDRCKKFIVPAGFVCVAVDPLGGKNLEGAIRFLAEHANTYRLDPDNFFTYGYSKGGWSAQDGLAMDKVKGVVSDNGVFNSRIKFEKKIQGKYPRVPAFLMIHCDVDPKVTFATSVGRMKKKLEKANKKRGKNEQIQWQVMRFSKSTGCKHSPMTIKYDEAAKAMVSFIQSVVDGANPFTSNEKTVTSKR